MLINAKMGSKDSGGPCKPPPVRYNDSSTPKNSASPGIPAPPPLPPPVRGLSEAPRGPLPRPDPKGRSRLRNFNWEAIPLEKVQGRSSLWSSETFQGDLSIDTGTMEELFGKQDEEVLQRSYNHQRRSLSVGEAHVNKVFLLDSRRSMNIGILLKQFKRSAAEIVEDIRMGKADLYSSERLSELLKHLPDRVEVQRLKSFQGDREKLSEADLFILLLLDVPSYSLRLETLILKKDFHPTIVSQLSAARDLKTATEELLQCSELHFILKLVLKAGNFMNAGGYAGNAAGFRVSSLLKLADTKANKPGMNLLHFVVMEVQKKDPKYLTFADTLRHVQSASRLSEESLLEEFDKLRSRVNAMHKNLAAKEQQGLRRQMAEFLKYAEDQLLEVQKEIDELQSSKQNLVEFLCEDEDIFRLDECCKTFSCFCQKFNMAIKENKVREVEEERQRQWERKRLQKRHSMATCGSLEAHQAVDELERTLERNLQNLCRSSSVRLCRMRSFGSKSPNRFVPQSEHRERVQGYCDQKNAEQMRETSERVLRQQMEYRSSRIPNPGDKANFYPVSKIPMNSSCQAKADLRKSPPKDRTEISQLSLDIDEFEALEGALNRLGLGVNQQKTQHDGQLKDQYRPKCLDNSSTRCPASCVTKAEMDTQTEITEHSGLFLQPLDHEGLEILGQSKPFLDEGKASQPFHHGNTSKQIQTLCGPGINRLSQLHCTCDLNKTSRCQSKGSFVASSQATHTGKVMHLHPSGPKATKEGPLSECQCVVSNEEPSAVLEDTKDFSDKSGLEPRSLQAQPQPKAPPYQSRLETFKPIPTLSDSQTFAQSSNKPSAQDSKRSATKLNAQTLDQQGLNTLNSQRDFSSSQIPKQLPVKQKGIIEPQPPTKSVVDLRDLQPFFLPAPNAPRDSEQCVGSETHGQQPTSIILKTKQVPSKQEASIPFAAQLESERLCRPAQVLGEQQGSPASIRTVKQTLPPNVSTSSTETLSSGKSETLPPTLSHPQPESLKEDDSPRKSALKTPKLYAVKSFKQTLVKGSPKNTRQSVASPVLSTSSSSMVQTRSETCNPNPTQSKAELSRISQSKPGCFMPRIKHVEHLSVKQPAKDNSGPVPHPPQNAVEPQNQTSRVLQPQDMECNNYAKVPNDAHTAVHREVPNPCSKWNRELKKASENADSHRVGLRVENGKTESAEQKTVDNLKNSGLGRTGINLSKKSKNDLGIRRVHMNKDITLGSTSSLVTKQPVATKQVNAETRESKIPQKVSAGSTKPQSTKITGGFKEKRPSNDLERAKSEFKNSSLVTSKHPATSPEGPGHSSEHVNEPVWPSKKNSVARVAIHVIKNYEVNSTLTRGSRSPSLTAHPVWR